MPAPILMEAIIGIIIITVILCLTGFVTLNMVKTNADKIKRVHKHTAKKKIQKRNAMLEAMKNRMPPPPAPPAIKSCPHRHWTTIEKLTSSRPSNTAKNGRTIAGQIFIQECNSCGEIRKVVYNYDEDL